MQLQLNLGAQLKTYSNQSDNITFQGSTCLVEACRNRDLGMIDLLLKYGARDDECKALMVAAAAGESIIVSKLLALKANQGSCSVLSPAVLKKFGCVAYVMALISL